MHLVDAIATQRKAGQREATKWRDSAKTPGRDTKGSYIPPPRSKLNPSGMGGKDSLQDVENVDAICQDFVPSLILWKGEIIEK